MKNCIECQTIGIDACSKFLHQEIKISHLKDIVTMAEEFGETKIPLYAVSVFCGTGKIDEEEVEWARGELLKEV
jgi:hypothetical protein